MGLIEWLFGKKEKPVQCRICGKEFSSWRALGGHSRTHKKVTPKAKPNFACQKCGKRFPTLQALGGHSKKRFPTLQALGGHLKQMHSPKKKVKRHV